MRKNFTRRMSELDEILSSFRNINLTPSQLCKEGKTPRIVSFVNPYSYIKVIEASFPLQNIIFAADGALLVAMHNIFNRERLVRLSFDFTSLAGPVMSDCEVHGLRVGLIGGRQCEVERAANNIRKRFPDLNIVYTRDGYFDEKEKRRIFEKIQSTRTDVLICGMGTPRQEEFLVELAANGADLTSYTCGGFISQTAERQDYYPKIVMKYGLRWIYRFWRHDYVRKRVLIDYPLFVVTYVLSHVNRR